MVTVFDPETKPVFPETLTVAVASFAYASTSMLEVPFGLEIVEPGPTHDPETSMQSRLLSDEGVGTVTVRFIVEVAPDGAVTVKTTVLEPTCRLSLPVTS